ncbi:nucleotidyltransferase domain-containing protein [Infirmifilum lucidum]|uniref:Nucleotidyltransferase domain-containing protein n=2 Tax=Infirmifilum lucidum TaxID=2776706 RepID=A0A7L9FJ36_9CREN|nr:nucleotidyltransferase domain-containing protein [Infirmifilum lucidum]
MKRLDSNGKLFLFGSTSRGENTLASDIDILILTSLDPSFVIANLRKAGFDDPFEFHVVDNSRFELYKRFIKDLKEI